MKCRVITMATVALTWASAASGQQGRADLQYRAPIASPVTYVSVDSTDVTISGLPVGEMTSVTHLRSVADVAMVPAGDGFQATVTVKEVRGASTSLMGTVPIDVSAAAAITIAIGRSGPDAEELARIAATAGADPADAAGAASAFSAILMLPARALTPGETWTDTMSMPVDIDGMDTQVTTITRGTYVEDTVVDGVTLNVLRIVTDMNMTMSGTVEGSALTQTTTTSTEARVLWDSARHYVTSSDASGTIQSETHIPAAGMTMIMNGTTRSILTGTLNDGR